MHATRESFPPIIDGHNDTILVLEKAARLGSPRSFLRGDDIGHVDLPRSRAGGLGAAFFACFVPDFADPGQHMSPTTVPTDDGYVVPYARAIDPSAAREIVLRLSARLFQLEAESGGALRVVRSADELEQTLHGDALGAVFHLEGAEPIGTDLDLLYVLHAAGLRSLGITWSRPNAFGFGVPFRFPSTPDTGPGLTEAGRRLVAACNELRILVDLAHLNERGFWDVVGLTDAPVVVTHSAAHALAPHTRNLTDAQLDAIGSSGGVVGINLHVGFLTSDGREDRRLPIERVVDHIDHITNRIGIQHVALGSDFDGAIMSEELPDASALPALLAAMRRRGYDDAALTAFANENWLRVLRETWGS